MQAQAILDMRLQRLTGLERDKILEEHAEVAEADRALPGDPRRRARGAARSSSPSCARCASSTATSAARRSSTRPPTSRIEDLIADEDMVVTISHEGYIKRNAVSLVPRPAPRRPRQDRRDDARTRTSSSTSSSPRRTPTSCSSPPAARCYWLKVHEMPQAGRAARGKAIVNLLSLRAGREDLRLPAGARVPSTAATSSSPPRTAR